MKMFKTSRGIILSFGFDVMGRKADPRRIYWSDLTGAGWDPADRRGADWATFPFDVVPEFIRETADGTVVAFMPGRCIELIPVTDPYIWRIRVLAPEPIAAPIAEGDPGWPRNNLAT